VWISPSSPELKGRRARQCSWRGGHLARRDRDRQRSDFRLNPEVPLVVPEVNAEALEAHNGVVANPNVQLSRWSSR
jgi:hypothetical protein